MSSCVSVLLLPQVVVYVYAEIVGAYDLDVGAVALGHRPSVQCPILIQTPHFCSLLLPAPVNPTQAIANLNPLNLAPNPPLLLQNFRD